MSDLSAVREVWASRSSARSRADLLYLVYVAALSVLVLGIPALNSAGQLLSRPDVLPMLGASRAPQVVAAATLVAAAIAVLVGAVRGPALMAPFLVATLASSGLHRRDVLRRPFARALLVPVLGLALLAALVGSTLLSAGHAETGAAVLFTVARGRRGAADRRGLAGRPAAAPDACTTAVHRNAADRRSWPQPRRTDRSRPRGCLSRRSRVTAALGAGPGGDGAAHHRRGAWRCWTSCRAPCCASRRRAGSPPPTLATTGDLAGASGRVPGPAFDRSPTACDRAASPRAALCPS